MNLMRVVCQRFFWFPPPSDLSSSKTTELPKRPLPSSEDSLRNSALTDTQTLPEPTHRIVPDAFFSISFAEFFQLLFTKVRSVGPRGNWFWRRPKTSLVSGKSVQTSGLRDLSQTT